MRARSIRLAPSLGPLLVSVLAMAPACKSSGTASIDPPSTAKPDEPATQPSTRVVVSGRLRAHDGGALAKAEVSVRRTGFEATAAKVELDAEGRFRLEVDPGIYQVVVSAVDHAVVYRDTVVESAIEITGTLGTYARAEPGDALPIKSELLDATGKTLGVGPAAAKRVRAGVYQIVLSEPPPAATRVRYQIVDAGRSANGPGTSYQSDGGGDYWSLVELDGRTAIDIDLSKLPAPALESKLTWRGESATVAVVRGSLDRWGKQLADLRDAIPRTDGKIFAMTDANSAAAKALAEAARKEADATTDPIARVLLQATVLAVFSPYTNRPDDTAARREGLAWIVDNVPPDDPRLALLMGLDHAVVPALREADAELTARTEAWLERRASENPEPSVAIQALQILLHQADRRRDDTALRALYARASAPRLAGTFYWRFIEEQYDPERPLQIGKTLPSFDFAALQGNARVASSTYEGQVYLLEFWATWCAPCVADMPKLHDVYATINGVRRPKRGKPDALRRMAAAKQPKVDFVFVSLDHDAGEVAAFRKEHWSMPWTHAFVGDAGMKDVMQRFGFSGVPTAILVDGKGTILEVGETLRGDLLLPTLQRLLPEPPSR